MPDKESWKQHFEKGMDYGRAGDLDRAAESLHKAADLAPNEPYPHYELGRTLFLQGHYQEALKALRTTNDLSTGFFLVQTEIYLCENVIAGKLDQEALEVLRALQQLTGMGSAQGKEAVALSRRAIESAPACALGYLHLGKALLHSNPQVAEKSLKHCLALRPDDTTAIEAKMHLGLLRQAEDDLKEACHIWQSVIDEYAGNPHVRMCEVMLSQHCSD